MITEEIKYKNNSISKENNAKKTEKNKLEIKYLKKRSLNTMIFKTKKSESLIHRRSQQLRSLNIKTTPLKECISALSFSKEVRNNNPNLLKSIQSYIKSLQGFMNIFSNENNIVSMEEKLRDIALNMKYEYFNKNTVMFKYGDKGDKFYIILKGKIGFLIPQKVKLKLNEEEYLINLAHLYQNGEFELVKHIMHINQTVFDFGEDFEKYILEHISEFYKKNGKYKYSIRAYHKLIEISKNNFQIKNKIATDNISIKDYIDMNRIINGREASKKKKQIILFYYQHVNNFEDGQTFGYMALESKSNKRTSSAITLTNCELAFLTKDEYLSILGGIHNKSRNNIYELMSSFKLLGNISKQTFDSEVIHKIKFVNYLKGEMIIEENKKLDEFYIFYSGTFKLSINKNIIELNELIIKLKKIRGKILGMTNDMIQKDIAEQLLEIDASGINKKYIDEKIKKEYLKKHYFTLTIINENFLVGLPDTIEPDTQLSLFNCECISDNCDGYEINNKVFKIIYRSDNYKFNNEVNQNSLMKIDFYLQRIILYKKTLLIKLKNRDFSFNKTSNSFNNMPKNNHKFKTINPETTQYNEHKSPLNRNCLNKVKKGEKNKKYMLCKTLSNFNIKKFCLSDSNIKTIPNLKNVFDKNIETNTNNNIEGHNFAPFFQTEYWKSKLLKSQSSKKIKNKLLKYNIQQKLKLKEIFNEKSNDNNNDNYHYKSHKNIFNNFDEKNEIQFSIDEEIKEIKKKRKKYKILNSMVNDIKKENKYNQRYKDMLIKQVELRNKSKHCINIFNPVEERIKNNKLSVFLEYQKMNKIINDNCRNHFFNIISIDSMNNINYFLSRERKNQKKLLLNYKYSNFSN